MNYVFFGNNVPLAERLRKALGTGVIECITLLQMKNTLLPAEEMDYCVFIEKTDHTRLEGSLRAFQDDVFDGLAQGLRDIGREIGESHGVRVEIGESLGYPAVMNPPDLYDRVRAKAAFSELAEPSMTAEDFSWYQKRLPGLFLGQLPEEWCFASWLP